MSSKNSETSIFNMAWPRNKVGYQMVAPKITKKHVFGLTDTPLCTSVAPKSDDWEVYNPFVNCNGMAREFAHIHYTENDEVNKQQALNFATKYGLLGLNQSNGKSEESLKDWNEKIFWLRGVFTLFDSGEQDRAESMFNEFSFSPQVALTIPRNKKSYHKSLVIQPTSLYAAIWIQASQEVVGGKKREKCAIQDCHNWFLERGNKLTCSNACRIMKSRLSKIS